VKCAGEHQTTNCPHKEKLETPKCSNCGGDHTANHTKCPIYIEELERRQQQVSERSHKIQQTRTFTSNYTKPNTSYAKTTTNKLTNQPIHTPNSNLTPQTTQLNNQIDDIQTLMNEVAELNQICNISNLIQLVRAMK